MNNPGVSVIMSVLNGQAYIQQAIDSVLRQTYTNFEFIVINDGSTDKTQSIIEAQTDSRIVYLENDSNQGVAASINRGIEVSRGKFIARMDADDICLPHRLLKQVAFFRTHPDYAVCGSWARISDTKKIRKLPTDSHYVKTQLLFNSSFVNATSMFNTEVLDKEQICYDCEFKTYSEDYDLWGKLDEYLMTNIPEVLLIYRNHSENISHTASDKQQCYADKVRKKKLLALGLDPSEDEKILHRMISIEQFVPSSSDFLDKSEKWLLKIIHANKFSKKYDQKVLEDVIEVIWWKICRKAVPLGWYAYKRFVRSGLCTQNGNLRKQKLLIKSILKHDF